MAKNNKRDNYYRISLQWIIVVLLAYMTIRMFVDADYIADFEAYCPFGGAMALGSFFVNNSLSCSMSEVQIFLGVALLIGIVLFSKLFCSYICPLGTFTEWLGSLGRKWKMHFTLSGMPDRGLRVFKYGLLFLTFYYTAGSSELFCKEFDPYYAAFTGFGSDVVFWFALSTLALLIIGSFFVTQFWCKYLCPLGALFNIFTNAIMVAGVLALFVVLRLLDVEISWLWPLAVIVLAGFVMEIVRMKGWIFPSLKITRNEATCTSCLKCDKACSMAINISEQPVVEHIDCHLCGDCIYACPEKGVLTINRRETRWLPAGATVALVAGGLLLASNIELPTINLKWGEQAKIEQAAVFTQSGLKNVKCYGSSMSFANQMKRVAGVLGVETFARSHTVKVLYDPEKLNDEVIKKSIFSPTRTMLKQPDPALETVAVAEMGINKYFDSYDAFYLTQLLRQTDGVIGITTQFGEPVHAKIYYDPVKLDPQAIAAKIESPQVNYKSRGKEYTVELKFEVVDLQEQPRIISRKEAIGALFRPFSRSFNKFKSYKRDRMAVYELPMPQAANPSLRRQMMFMVSHLSTNDNVLRFETDYTDQPVARIWFLKDSLQENQLLEALRSDTLTVHYKGGKTGKVKNIFRFDSPGKILAISKN